MSRPVTTEDSASASASGSCGDREQLMAAQTEPAGDHQPDDAEDDPEPVVRTRPEQRDHDHRTAGTAAASRTTSNGYRVALISGTSSATS